MRIWSLHPAQLDRVGLVACWRETLLAQAVLGGATRGYTQHPQLERFRAAPDPLAAVGAYLAALADEADARGYRFARERIRIAGRADGQLAVTTGQLEFEWTHLGAKLRARAPEEAERWAVGSPRSHPLFRVEQGPVASWERGVASPG